MNVKINRVISIFTAASFLFSTVATPLQGSMLPFNSVVLSAETLSNNKTIPERLGTVTDAWNGGTGRLVYIIQDLHCHPGVQRNIKELIEHMEGRLPAGRIFVEGGSGRVDTSWIECFRDKTLRDGFIENLLANGRLSGVEYFAMTHHYPANLYGLDETIPHHENLKRLKTLRENGEIDMALQVMERELNETEALYLKGTLGRFVRRMRQETNGTRKHYVKLIKEAQEAGIDLLRYPHIAAYTGMAKESRRVDLRAAGRELGSLAEELRSKMPYGEYRALVDSTERFRRGEVLAGQWDDLQSRYALGGKYPHLEQYLAVCGARGMNPEKMLAEERLLKREIVRQLSVRECDRAIGLMRDYFESYRSWWKGNIDARDLGYVRTYEREFVENWIRYVGTDSHLKLEPLRETAKTYYRVNEERTGTFFSKLSSPSSSAGSPTVDIAVMGGFHTGDFAKRLKDAGISYILITPNVEGGIDAAGKNYSRLIHEQAINRLSTDESPEKQVKMLACYFVPLFLSQGIKDEQINVTIREGILDLYRRRGEVLNEASCRVIQSNEQVHKIEITINGLPETLVCSVDGEGVWHAEIGDFTLSDTENDRIGHLSATFGHNIIKLLHYAVPGATAQKIALEWSQMVGILFDGDPIDGKEYDALKDEILREAGKSVDTVKFISNPKLIAGDAWILTRYTVGEGGRTLTVHKALADVLINMDPDDRARVIRALIQHEAREHNALNVPGSTENTELKKYLKSRGKEHNGSLSPDDYHAYIESSNDEQYLKEQLWLREVGRYAQSLWLERKAIKNGEKGITESEHFKRALKDMAAIEQGNIKDKIRIVERSRLLFGSKRGKSSLRQNKMREKIFDILVSPEFFGSDDVKREEAREAAEKLGGLQYGSIAMLVAIGEIDTKAARYLVAGQHELIGVLTPEEKRRFGAAIYGIVRSYDGLSTKYKNELRNQMLPYSAMGLLAKLYKVRSSSVINALNVHSSDYLNRLAIYASDERRMDSVTIQWNDQYANMRVVLDDLQRAFDSHMAIDIVQISGLSLGSGCGAMSYEASLIREELVKILTSYAFNNNDKKGIATAGRLAGCLAGMDEGSLVMLVISGALKANTALDIARQDVKALKAYKEDDKSALAARLFKALYSYPGILKEGNGNSLESKCYWRTLLSNEATETIADRYNLPYWYVRKMMCEHTDYLHRLALAKESTAEYDGELAISTLLNIFLGNSQFTKAINEALSRKNEKTARTPRHKKIHLIVVYRDHDEQEESIIPSLADAADKTTLPLVVVPARSGIELSDSGLISIPFTLEGYEGLPLRMNVYRGKFNVPGKGTLPALYLIPPMAILPSGKTYEDMVNRAAMEVCRRLKEETELRAKLRRAGIFVSDGATISMYDGAVEEPKENSADGVWGTNGSVVGICDAHAMGPRGKLDEMEGFLNEMISSHIQTILFKGLFDKREAGKLDKKLYTKMKGGRADDVQKNMRAYLSDCLHNERYRALRAIPTYPMTKDGSLDEHRHIIVSNAELGFSGMDIDASKRTDITEDWLIGVAADLKKLKPGAVLTLRLSKGQSGLAEAARGIGYHVVVEVKPDALTGKIERQSFAELDMSSYKGDSIDEKESRKIMNDAESSDADFVGIPAYLFCGVFRTDKWKPLEERAFDLRAWSAVGERVKKYRRSRFETGYDLAPRFPYLIDSSGMRQISVKLRNGQRRIVKDNGLMALASLYCYLAAHEEDGLKWLRTSEEKDKLFSTLIDMIGLTKRLWPEGFSHFVRMKDQWQEAAARDMSGEEQARILMNMLESVYGLCAYQLEKQYLKGFKGSIHLDEQGHKTLAAILFAAHEQGITPKNWRTQDAAISGDACAYLDSLGLSSLRKQFEAGKSMDPSAWPAADDIKGTPSEHALVRGTADVIQCWTKLVQSLPEHEVRFRTLVSLARMAQGLNAVESDDANAKAFKRWAALQAVRNLKLFVELLKEHKAVEIIDASHEPVGIENILKAS